MKSRPKRPWSSSSLPKRPCMSSRPKRPWRSSLPNRPCISSRPKRPCNSRPKRPWKFLPKRPWKFLPKRPWKFLPNRPGTADRSCCSSSPLLNRPFQYWGSLLSISDPVSAKRPRQYWSWLNRPFQYWGSLNSPTMSEKRPFQYCGSFSKDLVNFPSAKAGTSFSSAASFVLSSSAFAWTSKRWQQNTASMKVFDTDILITRSRSVSVRYHKDYFNDYFKLLALDSQTIKVHTTKSRLSQESGREGRRREEGKERNFEVWHKHLILHA